MKKVEVIFLRLIEVDTMSDPSSQAAPSTPGQLELARRLVGMMKAMGVADARLDPFGYVYGSIPATPGVTAPPIGFIAHMDTSPDLSGKNVRARIVGPYMGGDIVLNEEQGITLSASRFEKLKKYVGHRLIVTDGTTLLGADDKAGIAEILTAAQALIASGVAHRKICIAFTPDEEIGRGADHFDVAGFGAPAAYTIDGGEVGEMEYENFNAADAAVTITGENIHPGSAKGIMKNSMHIAMEFDALLPCHEVPCATEGYEGFAHLCDMQGDVERTTLHYIIRDHDQALFLRRKERFLSNMRFLNEKYGENTVQITLTDTYYNMKEQLLSRWELIEQAKSAMREAGVEPKIIPIRGGTDGARLSYMGLPCPNLCTGGENGHGRYEFVSIEAMEKVVEIIQNIAQA